MFRSFFLAGFDCSTGRNAQGEWIDHVVATHHDVCADQDYRLLRDVGIFAAREAVRWPLVDQGGRYDFGSVDPFLSASRRYKIEVIWDLFHYGYPSDVDLFSATFPERFAEYCAAVATYISQRVDGECYFTPINEPSYFAWAAGEKGLFAPHCRGRGAELKRALVRAAIQGINAIRSVVSSSRLVSVDPLCRVAATSDSPEAIEQARFFNETVVFESWDMLGGRLMPELGGSPEHLDILGVNYYRNNQWELGREDMALADDDPRRVPLRSLLRQVFDRYGRELIITETSHSDEMRPAWLRSVADECEAVLEQGLPLGGVCLYPILGMPEWHEQDRWARMGLWDLAMCESGLRRDVCKPMLKALRYCQRLDQISRRMSRARGILDFRF